MSLTGHRSSFQDTAYAQAVLAAIEASPILGPPLRDMRARNEAERPQRLRSLLETLRDHEPHCWKTLGGDVETNVDILRSLGYVIDCTWRGDYRLFPSDRETAYYQHTGRVMPDDEFLEPLTTYLKHP